MKIGAGLSLIKMRVFYCETLGYIQRREDHGKVCLLRNGVHILLQVCCLIFLPFIYSFLLQFAFPH
jgi:hypothetical protein